MGNKKGHNSRRNRSKYLFTLSSFFVFFSDFRELMSGVDKLKLVSLVLSSMEKVSDVPPDSTDQQDAKSS